MSLLLPDPGPDISDATLAATAMSAAGVEVEKLVGHEFADDRCVYGPGRMIDQFMGVGESLLCSLVLSPFLPSFLSSEIRAILEWICY